jgi:hypothetical protein
MMPTWWRTLVRVTMDGGCWYLAIAIAQWSGDLLGGQGLPWFFCRSGCQTSSLEGLKSERLSWSFKGLKHHPVT